MSSTKKAGVMVRLPNDLTDRADALLPFLEETPLKHAGRVSRSTAIRYALELGLEALEARRAKEEAATFSKTTSSEEITS